MTLPADFCWHTFLVFGKEEVLQTSLSRLLFGSKWWTHSLLHVITLDKQLRSLRTLYLFFRHFHTPFHLLAREKVRHPYGANATHLQMFAKNLVCR